MVEEKLRAVTQVIEDHGTLIGNLDLDQMRQDGMREIYYDRIIPRLEAVETKIEKLIDILEKVIQHVS